MARGMKVEIDCDTAKAVARFRSYAVAKQAGVKGVVKKTAEAVKEGAKKRVLVDTGDTRDSIQVESTQGGLSAKVGPTKPRGWKAPFIEFGTKKMAASPFLHPAAEEERTGYVNEMRKELAKLQ
ncbi:phage protein, HK97 gp10 family [Marininema mesophilum]|uniref:Phage protein, HK97 gp10 family n=1 Tax=Marininema mesophilum TaxID=1048340 RepID=A0A1H3BTA6_9BACL|nr:HK97-gp10 family putative phage morphogenesis protein [Marininema mesophilum]SDX45103.1 phage protein, HK97 gp10 family [Marininema mesophilum]